VFVYSVYKDGVEVYNTSSSSSAAGAAAGAADDAVMEASCVVGDKFSCGVVLNDDEKQLRIYFSKNNHKVCLQSSILGGLLTIVDDSSLAE